MQMKSEKPEILQVWLALAKLDLIKCPLCNGLNIRRHYSYSGDERGVLNGYTAYPYHDYGQAFLCFEEGGYAGGHSSHDQVPICADCTTKIINSKIDFRFSLNSRAEHRFLFIHIDKYTAEQLTKLVTTNHFEVLIREKIAALNQGQSWEP